MDKYNSFIEWGDNLQSITRLNSSISIDNNKMHIHCETKKEDFNKKIWRNKRAKSNKPEVFY